MKIGDKITIEVEAVKSIRPNMCLGCFAEDSAYFCKNKMSLCQDEDLIFVVVEKTKQDEI